MLGRACWGIFPLDTRLLVSPIICSLLPMMWHKFTRETKLPPVHTLSKRNRRLNLPPLRVRRPLQPSHIIALPLIENPRIIPDLHRTHPRPCQARKTSRGRKTRAAVAGVKVLPVHCCDSHLVGVIVLVEGVVEGKRD